MPCLKILYNVMLQIGGGKTISLHWAQSRDQGLMYGQDKEDLAQVENFGFNLQRLHLLHQHVLEFQSTKILSLMRLRL
jgi:hypothetical protein